MGRRAAVERMVSLPRMTPTTRIRLAEQIGGGREAKEKWDAIGGQGDEEGEHLGRPRITRPC
jgi:hypothetical protein